LFPSETSLVSIRDRRRRLFCNSLPDRDLLFDGSGTALDATERSNKEANMVSKRGTKAAKRVKKVKSLPVKSTSAKQAKKVKGGEGWIEINSFQWGVGRGISSS